MRHPDAPDLDLRPAWRLNDAQLQADAIAFWNRLGLLPPDVSPPQRAQELALTAYSGDELVGVSTVTLERIEFLRARFALLRASVDPHHRHRHGARALGMLTHQLIERWAIDHPAERLAGMAAVIESPDLAELQKKPIWPNTGLILVGHTKDGRQVRVAWFDHFRFD